MEQNGTKRGQNEGKMGRKQGGNKRKKNRFQKGKVEGEVREGIARPNSKNSTLQILKKQNDGNEGFIEINKKKGKSGENKYLYQVYVKKKHNFELVFICKNSQIFVLRKAI